MSHHKACTNAERDERGVTLVELIVVMALTLVIGGAFYTFFKTNMTTYLNLQKDASGFTDLAVGSHRIANVVRGLTDIITAEEDELVLYGYFFPSDTYVSLIRYYQNGTGTVLYADVTPMTANPPIGSPIPAQKESYIIIPNLRLASGTSLFRYQDSAGAIMALPITDLHTIKGVQINLGVSATADGGNQAMNVQVSLRNRKTNL